MTTTCAAPIPMPPTAAQASLRTDAQYISLLAAQSTWPAQYVMSTPVPAHPLSQPRMGLAKAAVEPEAVDAYNQLLPRANRMLHRASQERPQTELVNTAAYVALGRGVANHVDDSTALLLGNRVPRDAARAELAERRWDRFDYLTLPAELRTLPGTDLRLPPGTRVSPTYAQPYDDQA